MWISALHSLTTGKQWKDTQFSFLTGGIYIDHSEAESQASTLPPKYVHEQQCLEYYSKKQKGAMKGGKQIVEHSQWTNGGWHPPPCDTTGETKGDEGIHGNARSPP